MNSKFILTTIFLALSVTLFAQKVPLAGTVIDRTTNLPVQNATVRADNNVDEQTVATGNDGKFELANTSAGSWKITISADGFSNYETSITLEDGAVLNLGTIYLYPMSTDNVVADFGGIEDESSDYTQAGPALLSSSQDVFSNIASYNFSEMRFKTRGYDYNFGQTYVNGLALNDINTGNSPFSLWSGLNDAMRNQEGSVGMSPTAFGTGVIGGMTNITTHASQIRKGFRVAYANGSQTYAHRLMVTYQNEIANDLFLAVSASARYGSADNPLAWVTGSFYQGYSYFLGLEKRLNDRESVSLTVFGAPIKRGAQMAGTQEVYDLVEDPFYNPNWGYQNGKVRNARMRDNHEPVVMLDYTNKLNDKLKLTAITSFRFGKNAYTALDWYDAPDPRPDYYRYLPSYFIKNMDPTLNDFDKYTFAREGWRTDENIRQINWDQLYNVNYNNQVTLNNVNVDGNPGQSISGMRSKYVIEERRTDQRDWNSGITLNALMTDNLKINGGVNYRWNRTEYFKVMRDLLGGEFWLDVDQFAERDFPNTEVIQNDLNNPNRIIREGDKYSYDYYSYTQKGKAWAVANYSIDKLDVYLAGDLGFSTFYREGLYKKGLFPDNSYGKSDVASFLTYTAQGGANYKITGNHIVSANVNVSQHAPYFQESFISPRTRNTLAKNLAAEQVMAGDLTYNLRMANAKVRVSGYYTLIENQNKVMMFYDDVARAFSNYVLNGIDQRYTGVELGTEIHIWKGISFRGALNYGDYIYTSNPLLTQTQDNSDEVITVNEVQMENVEVPWKDAYVPSTPQLAISYGLDYRAPRNWLGGTWFFGTDLNYYDRVYVDMNPARRVYAVNASGLTDTERNGLMSQEKYKPGYVLNANLGVIFYLKNNYQLGVNLAVNNILNNLDLRSGGYEQSRLSDYTDANTGVTKYTPFDSKYYYMYGTTYFLNVYFRF